MSITQEQKKALGSYLTRAEELHRQLAELAEEVGEFAPTMEGAGTVEYSTEQWTRLDLTWQVSGRMGEACDRLSDSMGDIRDILREG